MPKKGSREAERSAAMVMTYFRPHTLLRGLADKHVLHLADFRGGHDTWQKALTHWLNGGVLCEESKKHINNFLAVTRARPAGDDDELDGNSDDMLSDEELFVTSGQLDEALGTAHAELSGAEEEQDVEGRSSRAAMRRGADAWPTEAGDAAQHRAGSKRIAADVLKKIFASAAASQARVGPTSAHEHTAKVATVREQNEVSVTKVMNWLEEVRSRQNANGSAAVKHKQFEVVERVAKRVCQELSLIHI